MKIFKYPVPPLDNFIIRLPADSEILCFNTQHNEMFILVLINENNPVIDRHFYLVGTGHDLEVNPYVTRLYIGTVQLNEGSQEKIAYKYLKSY